MTPVVPAPPGSARSIKEAAHETGNAPVMSNPLTGRSDPSGEDRAAAVADDLSPSRVALPGILRAQAVSAGGEEQYRRKGSMFRAAVSAARRDGRVFQHGLTGGHWRAHARGRLRHQRRSIRQRPSWWARTTPRERKRGHWRLILQGHVRWWCRGRVPCRHVGMASRSNFDPQIRDGLGCTERGASRHKAGRRGQFCSASMPAHG